MAFFLVENFIVITSGKCPWKKEVSEMSNCPNFIVFVYSCARPFEVMSAGIFDTLSSIRLYCWSNFASCAFEVGVGCDLKIPYFLFVLAMKLLTDTTVWLKADMTC